MQQLTSLDAQFLALESDRHVGHVAGLAILDPSTAPRRRVGCAEIKGLMRERLPLLPPLRRRLCSVPFNLDYPYWIEDPDFDLDYHVREIALAPPGSDEQLAAQVARIHERRLDRERPLWEVYVIHGLASGHVAMLTKIHHALVDDMSSARRSSGCCSTSTRAAPARLRARRRRRTGATAGRRGSSSCSPAGCSGRRWGCARPRRQPCGALLHGASRSPLTSNGG